MIYVIVIIFLQLAYARDNRVSEKRSLRWMPRLLPLLPSLTPRCFVPLSSSSLSWSTMPPCIPSVS